MSFDRLEAEQWVRRRGWLEPEPAVAIVERYATTTATVYDLRDLIALAEQHAAEELGSAAVPAPAHTLTKVESDAVRAARELVVFCDGLEAGGSDDYARRSRATARNLVEFAKALDAERSVRQALGESYHRALGVLERRASDALTSEPTQ